MGQVIRRFIKIKEYITSQVIVAIYKNNGNDDLLLVVSNKHSSSGLNLDITSKSLSFSHNNNDDDFKKKYYCPKGNVSQNLHKKD